MGKIKYLDILKSVLEEYFEPWEYSLSGYSENALCMEETDQGEWIVFNAERGCKFDVTPCESALLACLVFLSNITSDKSERENVQGRFLEKLNAYTSPGDGMLSMPA